MLAHATTYLERAQESIGEMKKKSAVSSELLTKQACTMYQRTNAHEFACGKAVSRRVGEIRDDSRCEGAVPVLT